MRNIFIILFALATILTSCNAVANKINGRKKPQQENYETLSNYVKEKNLNIDINNTLFLSQNNGIEVFYKYKPYNVDKVILPDIYMYDNHLNLIDDNALGGCIFDRPQGENNDYYTNIYAVNEGKEHPISLAELEPYLVNYKQEKIFPFSNPSDEKIIFVVWAKYTGDKFIRNQVDYTLRTLKTTKIKYKLYFLNLDNYHYQ